MRKVSEELLQRDLINNPQTIGKWTFYNIGATSIKNLKEAGIITKKTYKGIENKKPDGIVVLGKKVFCTIENKKPSELNTKTKIKKAIEQALEISKGLKAKIAIVTDTTKTIWLNGITGDFIIDENNKQLVNLFDPNDQQIVKLFEKIDSCISKDNSQLIAPELQNPTPLAKQIWQDIWTVSGATPENCLYTFVEIFIFKYLSDLEVLKGMHNFYSLISMYDDNTDNEVLEYYANTVRPKIKQLFPKNTKDNTTIINGTIFVSKDDKAVEGYSGVFKKILQRFYNYGKLEKIDYDFKSKIFESFLKESISKKNWGQFFTPLKVVKPMVKMADIHDNMSICDPACGVGKFLLEAVLPKLKTFYKIKNGKLCSSVTLHGFDKGFDREEQKTIILAKANMLIYFSDLIKEYPDPKYTKIFADLFNETFTLKTNSILGTLRDPVKDEYDLILTNPPYVTSGSSNLKDEIRKDPVLEKYYTANGLGVEGLFMEWIINALKPNGKAFVVIPDGILNRQNDYKLRKFICQNCIIDALISLPLNTFFTTNKKTYIIALTKKDNFDEVQQSPVFSYLVSDIGETLDIYRFDTGENQIETAVDLFNQFKGSKNRFRANDPRCKIFKFSKFVENCSKGWIIDKWWTYEERVSLGIIEKTNTMSPSEFGNMIGEAINEISEYQSLFNEIDIKKKDEIIFRKYKLNELFKIEKGCSKYTKKYGEANRGQYPVFSASNSNPLTYMNTYDYDVPCLSWSSNGFAGYIMILYGKFSINGDRGILIPRSKNISLKYVKHILQPTFREMAKGRKGEKGKDEFTKLYPSMIEDLEIDMPTSVDSGEISLEYQENFIAQYSIFEEFENKVNGCVEQISSTRPNIDLQTGTRAVKISELFDLVKGKSKYTNKYFTEHQGIYPVFSSQTSNDGIIAQIDTYDFDCECLTWTTDGVYAGTVFYRNGKFSMTTHCGAMCVKEKFKNTVYMPYVHAFLSEVLKHSADGEQNKRLTVNILKDVIVEIPINKAGCFDVEMQKTYADTFEKFTELQKEVVSKLNSLLGITIV